MGKDHETKALAQQEQSALPVLAANEPLHLLEVALEHQGGAETIERIAALYERAEEKEQARAFFAAMREFTANMPPIPRTRAAKVATREGSSFGYKYADLDEIARAIKAPLEAAGLSYTWDSEVGEDNRMTVTCTVRHIGGHGESASFTCPTTSKAGMSDQQKFGAALTFGRRQSLIQVLGLTTCDQDNDGADPEPAELITESQAAELDLLIENVAVNKERFLKWLKIDHLSELPKARYGHAVRALEAKRKRGGDDPTA